MPHPTIGAIIPPDFLTRHDLLHRLCLAPLRGLTPVTPWAPLSDAEWAALAPILAAQGCGARPGGGAGPGRPLADPRARLDAIFRAVTLKHPGRNRAPWSMLPAAFGKPDTISRGYRRWAHADLWARLLAEVARPDRPPALAGLTHRICCAFRRGIRLMGLRAIVLARRLGLYSALPAPSQFLPDPDLSEVVWPLLLQFVRSMLAHPDWRPPDCLFRAFHGLLRLAGGRGRISGAMEPA